MRRACFPEYLGLVNPVQSVAYAMLYEKEGIRPEPGGWILSGLSGHLDFLGPRDWSPRKAYTDLIVDWMTECERCDAFLIVSPYVKFVEKPTGLERAKLSFRMDGEYIIQREPLSDYVIAGNGSPKPISYRSRESFYSCLIDGEHQADASHTYGVMAPNATHLEVLLHRVDPPTHQIRIECGFVSALYTTKGGVERKIESLIHGTAGGTA